MDRVGLGGGKQKVWKGSKALGVILGDQNHGSGEGGKEGVQLDSPCNSMAICEVLRKVYQR